MIKVIKVHSISEIMGSNMEVLQVSVTFQEFTGNLSFNVTVPITNESLEEGVTLDDLNRKQVIQMAREKIAAMILENGTQPLPEPETTVVDPIEPTESGDPDGE